MFVHGCWWRESTCIISHDTHVLFIQQEIWPLRAMKQPDSAAEVQPFQLGRFGIDSVKRQAKHAGAQIFRCTQIWYHDVRVPLCNHIYIYIYIYSYIYIYRLCINSFYAQVLWILNVDTAKLPRCFAEHQRCCRPDLSCAGSRVWSKTTWVCYPTVLSCCWWGLVGCLLCRSGGHTFQTL